MYLIMIVGILVGIADAASLIDVPNWVNWALIGGPVAATALTIVFGAWLVSKIKG